MKVNEISTVIQGTFSAYNEITQMIQLQKNFLYQKIDQEEEISIFFKDKEKGCVQFFLKEKEEKILVAIIGHDEKIILHSLTKENGLFVLNKENEVTKFSNFQLLISCLDELSLQQASFGIPTDDDDSTDSDLLLSEEDQPVVLFSARQTREAEIINSPSFFSRFERKDAEHFLKNQPAPAFLIRPSSKEGYAISYRNSEGSEILHQLIHITNDGKIAWIDQEFVHLKAFLEHVSSGVDVEKFGCRASQVKQTIEKLEAPYLNEKDTLKSEIENFIGFQEGINQKETEKKISQINGQVFLIRRKDGENYVFSMKVNKKIYHLEMLLIENGKKIKIEDKLYQSLEEFLEQKIGKNYLAYVHFFSEYFLTPRWKDKRMFISQGIHIN